LFQWSVFAGELHNFLGNNTSKECCLGTYGTCWVYCRVQDYFFLNTFNCFSTLNLSFLIDCLSKSQNFFVITWTWISAVLWLELMNSSDCEMKLEWPSKISQVTVLYPATGTSWWIFVTSCQIMEWYWTWYFYIFNDTLSLIRSEFSSIKFDCERLSTNKSHYLDWLKIVYLSHSFYFSKSNVIVDLVGMALVFMNCHSSFFFVWNKFYNKLLCLLTITVEDEMLWSEVHESITSNT
jgi:hypothetical protein